MSGIAAGRRRVAALLLGGACWVALALVLTGIGAAGPPGLSTSTLDSARFLPVAVIPPPPTATATATAPPETPWLAYFNLIRGHTGLELLNEDLNWSNGDWLHGRYMVKNDYVGHSENPANPWYTDEGLAAAQSGNVFVSSWLATPDETVLDFWLSAPFHLVAMIDPQLATTAFGSYHENIGSWRTGATLDVARGRGPVPAGTTFPILYPAPGAASWLQRYGGGEFPDPLASCPGYGPPTGPPIIAQVGPGDQTPSVTDFALMRNGTAVPVCAFDETSYVNPDPYTQSSGRLILGSRDAIVLLPRQPFSAGDEIAVAITTSGQTIAWSFTIVGAPGDRAVPVDMQVAMR